MNEAPLQDLIDLLDLRRVERSTYRSSVAKRSLPRVFGGQVLAQAILAAGATTTSARIPHSVHAHFLRGGDPTGPIDYDVVTVRDGRSFSTRRVAARQRERHLFEATVSFHEPEDGPDHQLETPGVTGRGVPEALPPLVERLSSFSADLPSWWTDEHPFDLRFTATPSALALGDAGPPHQEFWVRAAGQVPDSPLLHAALTAYVSDLTLLDPALLPHGRSWYGNRIIDGASLDHAMWFHRDGRIDRWLHCRQSSPVAANGRCYCTGEFRDVAGQLLSSVAQEGILRERHRD
ncbi:acyl-CoA thioesterase II [Rhodococcus fascians]|nr:acyl-CoA thioesterase II [Rhodococcus fascians]